MTFPQRRHSHTNLAQALDMLCQRMGQRGCHITCCGVVFGEVGCINRTFDVSAEICATGFIEGDIRSFVNLLAFLELHFRTVIEAWNTAMGEHKGQVLSPNVFTFVKTATLHFIRSIVMGIHINYVPGSIVVVLVVGWFGDVPCSRCTTEVPVLREVNHM